MCDCLIIKNVSVIDPVGKKTERKNLYIKDGVFSEAFDDRIKEIDNIKVLDGTDCYAAPGFIDSHVHVFGSRAKLGIEADKIGIRQGVSKVVDAGSTGINDFSYFQKEVIDQSLTDVYYFINISRKGLCESLSELTDPKDFMTGEELSNFMKQNKNLVGIKARMSGSVVKEMGLKPLIYARGLSDQTGLPIMVHIGNAPPELGPVLNLLKKGDIVTHCFHGKQGGISDYSEDYKKAVERGVHFDVGHGNASFSYQTVDKVLGIANMDYSISTDLYSTNYVKPVESLMTTMSKFIPFHLPIEEIVHKVTTLPGEVLKIPCTDMKAGSVADLTLFQLIESEKKLIDSEGYEFSANSYIKPYGTIKRGKVVWMDHV